MTQDVERTSVTLPADLLAAVDDVVESGGYDSRSEATRDALRAFVTDFNRSTGAAERLSGTVVVLYDHDTVSEAMTGVQHDYADCIVSTQHVHLGAELCLESVAVDGSAAEIDGLVSRLRPLSGVRRVELVVVEAEDRQAGPVGDA